ncbi:hypothetical protein GLOTRDRAFT_117994 [Gloeophyllum trabeum ATCC 11539]|uniref:Rhodopsin domain-containing protein n=1 Tax=Gloeophyllum trabeum (strain ATCC 11539 / FP-39264 / Madison 617) TaxID=670483 RepID=S7RFB4_GLOTA|nr:uncharacterized protein GLOTRDRAFT_117994 [Gloeophyllum trabeum ATCC 11539]EPQ51199.1 hypothetical protein GLOTRDRAFT_117994 [Gloeophyllum trabeum ATCC 11539]
MVKQPSFTAIRVVVSIVHPIAILCSAFRLLYRWRRRRFWWDDGVAGFSMLFDIVFFVVIWIRTYAYRQPPHTRIVTYWIVSMAFTFVLWSARLSMLLSIIRIIPPPLVLRRLAYGAAALFVCIWIALVSQKAYKCGKAERGWMEVKPWTQCRLGRNVAVTELVTDFVGDAVLVYLPVQLLWHARKLPSNHRTLLLVVFSGSMVTTLVSIPHAVIVMGPEGQLEGITAHIEAGISLIVANLLVLMTLLYRVLPSARRLDDDSDDALPDTRPDVSVRATRASQWVTRESGVPDSFDLKFLSTTAGGRSSTGTRGVAMSSRDHRRFGEVLEEEGSVKSTDPG